MKNNILNPIPLIEAARLMAVSPRTVRRLIDRGDLTPIRFGATLALTVSELPSALHGAIHGEPARPLMTIHEVAGRLKISPRAVREITDCGRLRAIQIGGSKRWSPLDVEALMTGARNGE